MYIQYLKVNPTERKKKDFTKTKHDFAIKYFPIKGRRHTRKIFFSE